jgi:shikimate kinase
MQKVILVGYMGSGKSVIAKLLANKINYLCYELDDLIEKKADLNIESIFSQKGELYFRKLEHEIFADKMSSKESFVLSTGGGTPCYFGNHELLQKNQCVSIYLKASIDTLCNRLEKERSNRPLLAQLDSSEMKEFIAKHVFERSYFYHQAKHILDVDDKSPEELVEEIKKLL